jgi:hypothetical protein
MLLLVCVFAILLRIVGVAETVAGCLNVELVEVDVADP